MSKSALCRAANVSTRYYAQVLRGLFTPSERILFALRAALRAPVKTEHVELRSRLIEQTWRYAIEGIGPHYRVTTQDVIASRALKQATANAHWLACAHAHQAALHLVRHVTGLSQADIARHFGVTRAALSQAMSAVEARREDPAFDEALTALERKMA